MSKPQKSEKRKRWKKPLFITIAVLIVGFGVFFGIKFYYPFGEGVKTGQLNYVVYKGIIFKTYEGKLIQSGFWTNKPGGIQSNEFEFSVRDKELAEKLMHAGGQIVELHYKEYFGALPWRGYSRYIVDDIVSMSPAQSAPGDILPSTVHDNDE